MSTRLVRSLALPAVAIGVLLLALGCAQKSSTQNSSMQMTAGQTDASPSVEKAREAGGIAKEIEKEPSRANEILNAHGLTPDSFQDLLYQIAQDPEMTQTYEAARTGSSS